MHPRRAPPGIRVGHCANQRADVGGHRRSPDASAAPPCPPESEASSVPGDDGLWLDDHECRSPSGPERARARPRATGLRSRAATAEAWCAAAPVAGAARPALRAGARRATAPMFGGSGGARQTPISSRRSVSIVGRNINCRNGNGLFSREKRIIIGVDRSNRVAGTAHQRRSLRTRSRLT